MSHYELKTTTSKKQSKRAAIFTIAKIKNQRKWTKEEDELLISLASKNKEKHWKEIAGRFRKKNSLQCFSRYKRIRPGIVKGSWKKEEDTRIINLVRQHGKAWAKISKLFGTRNGKQIRDRFINVLDPEIKKGKFTCDEDEQLIALFKKHGPKWATISKYFPNRTADMIKNRFHSSIKRKVDLTFEEEFKPCNENIFSLNTEQNTTESTKSLINLTQNLSDQEYLALRDAEYDNKPSLSCDSDLFSINANYNDMGYYETKICGGEKNDEDIVFGWDFESCFA